MKGIIFAILAGGFITLQGVANTSISNGIGTWQAATITQFTGFIVALLVMLSIGDRSWMGFKQVKPIYLVGGAFAAFVIFTNVKSIQLSSVTIAIAAVLIAQLTTAFIIEGKGWFEVAKQRMRMPQFLGLALMIIGVLILTF
ncbi:DMT family transporter [Caldalkalibacillus horti]|uniref:Transporter family-2 protein n=1 Tax=Caldalkalibacillus horti TaxID=77523 RepID=A0ABT9VZ10_9BACI|nr:DMT family transporter [Bacillus horti]MDQ0166218.1 transporter family-2 protein [Bacillus horti]